MIAYNEIESLPIAFADVLKMCNETDREIEVVFVDDGSQDGTTEWVRQKEKEYDFVKAVYHPINKGIGEALTSGYQAASGHWIAPIGADFQFHASDLSVAFPHLDKADVICFFRKNRGDYTLFRKLVSGLNKKINCLFFQLKIKDINWAKLYKNWVIKSIPILSQSSFSESERLIRAKKMGAKIIELEAPNYERKYGQAKGARFFTIVAAFRDLLKIYFFNLIGRI